MKLPKLALIFLGTAALAAFAGPQPKDDVDLQAPPGSYDNTDFRFHSIVPLGMESLELLPSRSMVNLLASATSAQFEGMERKPSRGHVVLLSSRGGSVRRFPEQVDFRISATTEGKAFDPDPLQIQTQIAPSEFLLALHFRLKVFHGLESFYIEPDSVEQIGEPADVPASERIYIAHFALRNLPTTDRILLEVLDPSGERVTRFHLDLL